MPLHDARTFVTKMRENRDFREKVLTTDQTEELTGFLRREGLRFDLRELAGAMAECMAQMKRQSFR